MGPRNFPVAIPMTIADPHVQFLSNTRGRNANGYKCRQDESDFAHFHTPGLLFVE